MVRVRGWVIHYAYKRPHQDGVCVGVRVRPSSSPSDLSTPSGRHNPAALCPSGPADSFQ